MWQYEPGGRPNQSCQKPSCTSLERFSKDATFAASLLNEGENGYDCERYDLLRHGHLPKMDRPRAQVKLGVSESQLEHLATRLGYLDVHDQRVPDRFHYIGQSWLYTYLIQTYSEDEYIEYLGRHPQHNLLMTNNGVVEVSINQPGRHLDFIKNKNRASYKAKCRGEAPAVRKCKSPKCGKEEGGTGLYLRASPWKESYA